MMMKLKERVVMQLLKSGLLGTVPEIPEIDKADSQLWKKVLKISAQQGVLAIVYDALQRLPAEVRPPKEILLRWAVNVDRIEKEYAVRHKALNELTQFFAEHDIPMMILKGAGLASHYPIPEHRPCGDIDIWLYGKQRQADALIREELGIPVSDEVHHHTVFTFKGVMVENHFDFLNCWSHRSNRDLERDLRYYATEKGECLSLGSYSAELPSPNLNALFLMRHMAVHFAAVEIGLRHIADWAVFLRTDGNKVDWPAIRAIYKAQNMDRFADAVTGLCVELLGVDRNNVYSYADDKALQELILRETLTPAFAEEHPKGGFLRPAWFKMRRWWANRWKHRLVYKDSLAGSFLWLCWAHIIRPKTIAS